LKESRKNREIEHEVEVQESKPNQDENTPSNGKVVGKDKKEPYKPLPPFFNRPRGENLKVDEAN